MSTGLLNQLRSYYESVDESQDPIRPEEVELLLESVRGLPLSGVPMGDGHVRPLTPLPERVVRRRWVVVGAAAAVVLVMLVPVLVLSGGPDVDVDPELGAATVVSPATALDVPSPTAEAAASGWSRVPHDAAVFGGDGDQVMSSVTIGGPGLVAVGTDGTVFEHGDLLEFGDAAVWTSFDGVRWARVPHDAAVFGGAWISGVTAGGPGLVAVGTSRLGAAVWTSPDGMTWSRVPHDEIFDRAEMSGVTTGGPGLVAVGTSEHGAAAWTSRDGLAWSLSRLEPADSGKVSAANSVTEGGPGLVAVGWVDNDGEHFDGVAAVWTSPDGMTWSRVSHDESVLGTGSSLNDVIDAGPGFVAVGDQTSPEAGGVLDGAVIWTSVDGITWTRVPFDYPPWNTEIESVIASGPGLVAVGWQGNLGGRVWTSPDGITWSLSPFDNDLRHARMASVVAAGSSLVAVGESGGLTVDADAAVWVWSAPPEG